MIPDATESPASREGAAGTFLKSLAARGARAGGRLLALWTCARIFSVAETGRFAFWMTTGAIIALISDFGLSEHMLRSSTSRLASESPVRRFALAIRMFSLLPIASLIFVPLALLGPGLDFGAWGALIFGFALGLADFLGAARRAHGEARLEVVESVAFSGAAIAVAVATSSSNRSFEAFAVALGLAAAVLVLGRMLALARSEKYSTPLTLDVLLSTLRDARWLWPRSLLGWLYLDATVLILGFVSNAAQVAVFAGAARLVGLVTQPMLALGFVFIPALAREVDRGMQAFRDLQLRVNRICILMIPALVATSMLLGKFALSGLGADYQRAVPVLWVLALSFSIYACVLSNLPLIVLGHERLVVRALLLGQLLLAAMALALSPRWGAVGASVAVMAGLTLPKALIVAGYRRAQLPLGGTPHLLLLLAIATWSCAASIASGATQIALLGVAGAISAVATWRVLSRTSILIAS